MEGEPSREPELSQVEQVNLAETLFDAVDQRNQFIAGWGGFDDFFDVHQYVDDNRAVYDKLEEAVSDARKQLDEMVLDKKALAEHLRSLGKNEVAERITGMFSVK